MLLLNRIPNLRGGSMESWFVPNGRPGCGHREVIEIGADGSRTVVANAETGNIAAALCKAADVESWHETMFIHVAEVSVVREKRRVVLFRYPLAFEAEEWTVMVLHETRIACASGLGRSQGSAVGS